VSNFSTQNENFEENFGQNGNTKKIAAATLVGVFAGYTLYKTRFGKISGHLFTN